MTNRDEIIKEAARWLLRLRDRNLPISADEREAFRQWLRRSAANREEFLSMLRLWRHLQRHNGDLGSIERLAQAARADSDIVPLPVTWRPPQPDSERLLSNGSCFLKYLLMWTGGLAAATFVIVAVLGWMRNPLASPSQMRTAVGEQKRIALDDGSFLMLNTSTEVQVHLNHHLRHIRLVKGEARFEVARDPQRPFIVTTPQAAIRSLGTVFNVHLSGRGSDITVFEGRVEVTGRGTASVEAQKPFASMVIATPRLVLVAGKQASVTLDGQILPDRGPPFERVSSWTQGRLVAVDEPLATIVEDLNRYRERSICIADPEAAALSIAGIYDVNDPKILFEYLREYRGIRVEEAPDGTVTLTSKGKELRQ